MNVCKILQDYKICKWSLSAQIEEETVFQRFHYATCKISLKLNSLSESVCLNSECIMIIDDCDWIKKHWSEFKILCMKNSIIIWSIESTRYLTDEYVILNFYISDLVNSQIEVIEIIVKVHLVHNFKAKLLIDVDILNLKKMNISFFQQILIIDNEWKMNIYIHAKNNIQICIKVWAFKQIIISFTISKQNFLLMLIF